MRTTEAYDEDAYKIEMLCLNCGSVDDYYLDTGVPLTELILKNTGCQDCECKGYLRKNFSPNTQITNMSNNEKEGDCELPAAVGFALGAIFF